MVVFHYMEKDKSIFSFVSKALTYCKHLESEKWWVRAGVVLYRIGLVSLVGYFSFILITEFVGEAPDAISWFYGLNAMATILLGVVVTYNLLKILLVYIVIGSNVFVVDENGKDIEGRLFFVYLAFLVVTASVWMYLGA